MKKICTFENCREEATHAFTYGNPDRCNRHRENRKKQYSICYCGKNLPYFNLPGETKGICCSLCKSENMVNVISKLCRCGKHYPSYNEPGKKERICCAKCKTDTMVLVGRMCKCGSALPSFNLPGKKSQYVVLNVKQII